MMFMSSCGPWNGRADSSRSQPEQQRENRRHIALDPGRRPRTAPSRHIQLTSKSPIACPSRSIWLSVHQPSQKDVHGGDIPARSRSEDSQRSRESAVSSARMDGLRLRGRPAPQTQDRLCIIGFVSGNDSCDIRILLPYSLPKGVQMLIT